MDYTIPWGQFGFAEIMVSQFMFARLNWQGAGAWPGNQVYFLLTTPWIGVPIDASIGGLNGSGYAPVPPHVKATAYPYTDASKFIITHEIGHWIQGMNDEQQPMFVDYSAPLNGCDATTTSPGQPGWSDPDGHTFFQREHFSAAAVEGWADYMVATTFNRTDESDCTIHFTSVPNPPVGYDTDMDGFFDTIQTANELSCESAPWDVNHDGVQWGPIDFVATYVTARDWLEDVNQANTACMGSLAGVGNEFDWMRYFWDMRTDEGLNASQMVHLLDGANARSWSDNGSLVDRPFYRMYQSASQMGVLNAHTNQWDNGLDRW